MTHSDDLRAWSISLFSFVCVLQACSHFADDCKRNGMCIKGSLVVDGAGGAGGSGGTTTSVPCSDHPECGDTCEGGVPQFTPAGVLCDGSRVCSGEGNCVACDDTTHLCPQGYECNGGVCGLVPGELCSDNTACASGSCIGGHCCTDACEGECRSCDADTGFSCIFTERLVYHPACNAGEACDGAGNCKLIGNAPCTTNDQCLSGNCSGYPSRCTTP